MKTILLIMIHLQWLEAHGLLNLFVTNVLSSEKVTDYTAYSDDQHRQSPTLSTCFVKTFGKT